VVTGPSEHWHTVWSEHDPDAVSWYQRDPGVSLRLVRSTAAPSDAVVDVGGGTSALVRRLAADGYRDLTVVDIAAPALEALDRALVDEVGVDHGVSLVHSDIRSWRPQRRYRCWHDRAAFHFLTDPDDRAGYVELAAATIEPGGHLIVATFAPDGPEQCSGLPVHRSDASSLASLFAPVFDLVGATDEHHQTPWHSTQHFQYSILRRR
jgi:trans-aconitate methyltransferase